MINKVQLLETAGGDKSHCLSAWQSTSEELGIELPSNIENRIDVIFAHIARTKKKTPIELLEFLAAEGHHTPFEKSYIHFQIKADIATHIHCLKHRVGVSINTESARYKEFKQDKYYIPADWDVDVQKVLDLHCQTSFKLYHSLIKELQKKLGRKRAKETARFVLPYATQINFDMVFNFRSFMHFQKLRNSEHAQKEVREIAQKMLIELKKTDKFSYSLKSFGL